jgi:hypothetical protein
MYRAVVGTVPGPGGRFAALTVGRMCKLAGRIEAQQAVGVERLAVAIAGTMAAETMQQAWPPQCMGGLAPGRDWPQVISIGIAGMDCAARLMGGQQAMVGSVPQPL